jgi:CheY-like chemotaxis protein
MPEKPCVVVAEDEENDALLFRMAFQQVGAKCHLSIVDDGEGVIDYLSGYAPFTDRLKHPLPNLIVLDLKMPKMTGFEVLEWLAVHREFESIPVVILSSSALDGDIARANELGAVQYIQKPLLFASLRHIVQEFVAHWLPPKD